MVKNLDRIADQAALLYRIRDELLSTTDEGQHYINVYYAHSPGIAAIMDAHLDLAEQGLDVIDLLVPNLQALLDGNGGTMTITEDQIQQAQAFLDALAPYASPELQDAILAEEQRRPLAAMQDLTMEAAWAYLNGYTVNWLSPLDTSDPYIAQAGSTIPVQFTLLDMENNFVVDSSVQLQLLDDGGNVVLGPIGLGNNPDQGIAVQGQKYHYNLKTKGLDAGTYELQILYNSAAPGTPASRTILIKKR